MKTKPDFRRILLVLGVAGAFVLLSGCATKKYVRQQIDPLSNQISGLNGVSKQNTNDIKDVDQRAQQGIQDASQRADAADQKAQAASDRADSAQSMASDLKTQVSGVEGKLGNIDNYKPSSTVNLNFAFNRYKLDKKAQGDLDDLAGNIKDKNGYIIQIEGFTDSVGNKDYNLELSQKRAQEVVRYLAEKDDIPLYRMFIIGLGEAKPVDSNKSRAGRAENRRVEVHLLENSEIQSAQNQQ